MDRIQAAIKEAAGHVGLLPISQAKDVVIEQRPGTIREQAWDGRVRVELATDEAEDEFAHEFRHDGATGDDKKSGV